MIRLTRRYRFSASHRLHSPAFSEEQNRAAFGKCANPYGHGHNYGLEISVKGPLDSRLGRVIDVSALDSVVDAAVLQPMDHRDLNTEVVEFTGGFVPTTENLSLVICDRLNAVWPSNFPKLDRIRIFETRKNTFEIQNP